MCFCARVRSGCACGRGSGPLGNRNLPPCGRAVDGTVAALPVRDSVGELAFRRQVAGNVLIVRGRHLQVDTETFMRVENTNTFPELATDGVDCANLICVSGKKEETVGQILESVKHDGDGKIDIRTFLFELDDGDIAIDNDVACTAPLFDHRGERLVLRVESLHNRYQRHCRQGLQVNLLAIYCADVVRIRLDRGRKILDADNLLVWSKEAFDERNKIEPFIRSSLEKSVIQIVTIDIGNDALHVSPLKCDDPNLAIEVMLRLDRVWRVDGNSLSNRTVRRKATRQKVSPLNAPQSTHFPLAGSNSIFNGLVGNW